MTKSLAQRHKESEKGLVSALFKAVRADSWVNVLTGLGTATRDKLMSMRFGTSVRLTAQELEEMYHGDDMIARICDLPGDEMLREGFDLNIEPGDENGVEETDAIALADDVVAAMEDLGTREKYTEACSWARLYGGCAILVGADDGTPPERMAEPLREESIRSVWYLNVIDRRYLTPQTWYNDPSEPKFGLPKTFLIQPQVAAQSAADNSYENREVHESRLILFDGVRTSITRRQENGGFSESAIQRVYDVLRQFSQGWQSTAHLLTDAAQAVFKIDGLIRMISAGDTATIQQRMELVDMNRSVARALAVDAEKEEFTRQQYSFSGLDGVLQMFVLRLSAAANMPATLLMGQSPAGMNATGESDIRWFYDTIQSKRHTYLKPKLERLAKLIMLSKEGPTGGTEPEAWNITFPPLWQMTPKEEAEIRKMQAETDHIYVDDGVALPEEIALSRFPATGWSPKTSIDLDLRREVLEAEKEKALEKLNEPEPEPPEQLPPGQVPPAPDGTPQPPAPPIPEGQPTPPPAPAAGPEDEGEEQD